MKQYFKTAVIILISFPFLKKLERNEINLFEKHLRITRILLELTSRVSYLQYKVSLLSCINSQCPPSLISGGDVGDLAQRSSVILENNCSLRTLQKLQKMFSEDFILIKLQARKFTKTKFPPLPLSPVKPLPGYSFARQIKQLPKLSSLDTPTTTIMCSLSQILNLDYK